MMILTMENIKTKKIEIIALAKQYHAENIRVFGSVARGEAMDESDVDFLVSFTEKASFFDQVGLIDALSALLQRKVDVVSERAINPHLQQVIKNEALSL